VTCGADSIINTAESLNSRAPNPARAWKAVLVFVCVSLAAVAILWGLGSRTPDSRVATTLDSGRASRESYVGSESCAACHPGEFAAHSRSGHARTLRRAAQTEQANLLAGKTFVDPERGDVNWSYALRHDKFWTERHEGTNVERLLIDYAFGSGHHATTFVTLTDRTPGRPTMIEHRLTLFAHTAVPDITPGQGQVRERDREGMGPSGRHYTTALTLKCFECHTTTISNRGPLILDETTMIPNVGCERCHGPGQEHAQARRRGAVEKPIAMPFGGRHSKPADEIRLCGACHRLPETVDRAMIVPENPRLVRFQPVGLMQSACYQKSQGTLSCSTCHDPHARTSADLPAYEAVCLSCHQGLERTACKISPVTGCVGCHMPKRDASRGMMMVDHWIRANHAPVYTSPP
jgi:Cytochrome c554 and c-prime/Doubled CXXCH motif (Paired_CXXCH_1)